MSFGKALYFPFIHFQNENWLKHSLLYWDGIKRIVPSGIATYDPDSVRVIADGGLIENVDPLAGEEPYTKGVAKDFLSMLEILRKNVRGDFGRLITRHPHRNTGARIHYEKMDREVVHMLTNSGLAKQAGEWFEMSEELAGYYMLFLASHISKKQNAPMLSESTATETAGSYFQHVDSLDHEQTSSELAFRLARLVIPVPRPEDLSGLSAKALVEFHEKRKPERIQFRKAIEEAAQKAARVNDPIALKDFLEQEKARIETAVDDQRKTIAEFRVDVVDSLMAVSVPGFVGAGFAAVNANPVVTTIGSGFAIAASVVSLFAKARGERRSKIRECDMHYLLSIEKDLDLRSISGRAGQAMNEFVYD